MIETSKGSVQRETVSCHHYPGQIYSGAATAAVLGTDVVLAPFTWGWVLVAVSAFWGADGGGWWLLYLPPWGLDRNLLRALAFRQQTLPWIHQKSQCLRRGRRQKCWKLSNPCLEKKLPPHAKKLAKQR